jgi:hypothetical protein
MEQSILQYTHIAFRPCTKSINHCLTVLGQKAIKRTGSRGGSQVSRLRPHRLPIIDSRHEYIYIRIYIYTVYICRCIFTQTYTEYMYMCKYPKKETNHLPPSRSIARQETNIDMRGLVMTSSCRMSRWAA